MVSKTKGLNKSTDTFNIHELLLKGTGAVREYNLPAGRVLVRPLSDIEMEECQTILFKEIKNPETKKFILESEPDELLDYAGDESEEDKIKKVRRKLNYDVDYSELIAASTKMMLQIAYIAMRDFTEDFDPEDLRKLNGVKELAQYVQEISGYSNGGLDEIEQFRTDS
jgi:hypothetical protein